MKKLEGKVAVITGASRGLGLAVARLFARQGAKVVLGARSEEALQAAVRALHAAGLAAEYFICDVTDLKQVESLAQHAIKTYGHFDIWVNNAGMAGPLGPSFALAPEDFLGVLQTNIIGTYNGSRTAMRHFVPHGSGKLINVLGLGAQAPAPQQNAYASTKAWIRVFTLALAREYKDSGVGVYAILPGMMDTALLREVAVIEGQGGRLKAYPFVIRALAKPAEVPARKLLWLASSATDRRTGLTVGSSSPVSALFGFLRAALTRPAEPVEIQIKTLPSAFTPLEE